MDALHDVVKLSVNFFGAPLQVFGILAHFEARGSNTTGVHSLAGSIDDASGNEGVDSFGSTAHVGNFSNELNTVFNKHLGVFAVNFVLGSAGQSDINLAFPRLAACEELRAGELIGVGSNDVVAAGAEFEHVVDFFSIEAGGIIYVTVGTGDGHNLGAEFGSLQGCTPCYVAETGNSYSLALEVFALDTEYALYEVECAEAGSLGTDTAAAEAQALAGESTGTLAREFFVHTVHVAYFTTAYADIACGNVLVRTEVTPKFEDEGLAETHDFTVALAAGREVAAAFCATHGQSGESVFESLLETEEFEN